MGKKDSRIDLYIEKAADFAKPILKHVRALINNNFPEVDETIKWGFPHFELNGIVCSMASFKQHCSFSFWKASMMSDSHKILALEERTSMGHFGKIYSLSDLPEDKIFISYLNEALILNQEKVKVPSRPKAEKKILVVPDYFLSVLKNEPKAYEVFNGFSYSNQKDYVEWITEAKSDETRKNRIQSSIEWLSEGKVKNWKYLKK